MTSPAEDRLSTELTSPASLDRPVLAPHVTETTPHTPIEPNPSSLPLTSPPQPSPSTSPFPGLPIASSTGVVAPMAPTKQEVSSPIDNTSIAPSLEATNGSTPKQEPEAIENLVEADSDTVNGQETTLATESIIDGTRIKAEISPTPPLDSTSTTTLSSGSVTAPRRRRRPAAGQPTGSLAPPANPPAAPASPPQEDFGGADAAARTNLQYTVTISKRSNGNQPWEPSNVRPPMLGKMRRMTVQFAPFEGISFEVLFQCKDLKPGLHEGRLVVSANDKGIARNAAASPAHDESLFRTIVQPHLSSAQAVTVYLKPCWRGFGSNRERPVFSVTVAVRPAERECAFVILHSWNVELHSHKMESSSKGKAMDADGPFEVRGTIPLHILQQPALDSASAAAAEAKQEQKEEVPDDPMPDAPVE